ncbi:malto-oligosyltrehalose trehalohydrolase [Mucilaginibacter limnophilus]|uniref:Malto-oligosyltrehalose trehalohydrolase n=2 Tax=Mucilaginibacter limnophilus TaxID=1932778 RepID=A0A3S2ULF6_9SPHI|nr:malto-oligosyltrehalose trehalohydrolase [Mucilaginibacter limnophilus]
MKKIQPEKRAIGVNFNASGEAEILVWAPLVRKVSLVISERNERLELNQEEYGYWQLTTTMLKPGDTYKFLLDDETERPDPASVSQPEGVHGASKAINLKAFKWSDEAWVNPRMQDYIFYELHTGTFTPEGTFAAIEEKLDYLIELGITAIEIMPVAQFPGNRNWGYDGVFPFATQNSYGGAEGLMHLVDACHAKGMAVVLDVVYNHMGPEGNYFNDFGPYFTDKYNTPWGNAINFDDAWCDAVRHYFIENVLMWFRDFHIDALRLDAVHAIKDFSPTHILREIKQHTDALTAITGKKYHLIAETDLNDPRFINPLDKQGYGLDAQWIDEFHHALRVTAGEERSGYYSDFEGINHLAKAYADAYIYNGIYSPHRQKTFGAKTDNEGKQFVVFSQNHDQVGNRMLGERTSTLVSFEMQKLMAAAVLVAPYLPMLFMGEEWSEPHPFLYFTSHTDKDLAEAVRKGRKEEFKAFHAQGEAPDPQSEETFNESKLQWDLSQQGKHAVMLNYYQALTRLRKENKPLSTLNRKNLSVTFDNEQQTLILRRWHESEHVCCVMNFSKQEQMVSLPADADWRLSFSSADEQWGGSSSFTRITEGTVTISPESIIIFVNNHV